MYLSKIAINNFRIFKNLELDLQQGLNLIVGENNSGKTALIDAIRLILGTRDNERLWLNEKDFYYSVPTKKDNDDESTSAKGDYVEKFTIEGTFKGFNDNEAAPFLEWIAFDKDTKEYSLKLKLIAQRNIKQLTKYGRRITYDITAGSDENGTQMDGFARDLLRATYLKPLRDAEQELSSKRGSRLSQILLSHPDIKTDTEKGKAEKAEIEGLIKKLNDEILKEGSVYKCREKDLNTEFFSKFLFEQEKLLSSISFVDPSFREILEKLELKVDKHKSQGLGVNNLLFMATELLLLKPTESEYDLPLLLIEEPEAHIHPQYQLNLINYFENQQDVQVLMTTHSPNLASKVDLEKLIIFKDGKAFPLGHEHTLLDEYEYDFLRRFLDVTKASLFFAKGLMLVEGYSECLLLPFIADLINKPLHKSGVSIINVGHTGLSRYARIFKRKKPEEFFDIKIACITDLDIPPKETKDYLSRKTFNEYLETEIKGKTDSKEQEIRAKYIEPFLCKPWTLEYSLLNSKECAFSKEMYIATRLANSKAKDKLSTIPSTAIHTFNIEWADKQPEEKAALACKYFYSDSYNVSKPETIQYFVKLIEEKVKQAKEEGTPHTKEQLRSSFPKYLIDAIDFVTSNEAQPQEEQTECQPMPVA